MELNTTEEIVANAREWSIDMIDSDIPMENAKAIFAEFEEWIEPNDGDLEILIGSTQTLVCIDVKESGSSVGFWNTHRSNMKRDGYFVSMYNNDNIIDLFLNKLDISKHKSFTDLSNLKVSSHLLIKRKGNIIQFVPFNLRAWHAGQSCYNNRENFNDFSIGIELEGTSDSKFTKEQYESLNEVIMALKSLYTNIVNENILGHSDISPGRKKDPGDLFDWSKVK